MLSTVISHAYQLVGHAAPVLLALQDAPRPAGGGTTAAPAHGPAGGGPASSMLNMALPLVMVLFIYFAMIRPMGKQRKEQESLQKGLQKGDKVVTNAGMFGTVVAVEDGFVTLEIAERVRVKFLKDSISRKVDPATDKPVPAGAATATADAKK